MARLELPAEAGIGGDNAPGNPREGPGVLGSLMGGLFGAVVAVLKFFLGTWLRAASTVIVCLLLWFFAPVFSGSEEPVPQQAEMPAAVEPPPAKMSAQVQASEAPAKEPVAAATDVPSKTDDAVVKAVQSALTKRFAIKPATTGDAKSIASVAVAIAKNNGGGKAEAQAAIAGMGLADDIAKAVSAAITAPAAKK